MRDYYINGDPLCRRSSTKFIKALLDGSAQEEKETLAKLKDALGFRSPPTAQLYGYPYPVVVPYQQKQAESGDEVWILLNVLSLTMLGK
jgi:hypothetical protein